jgi:hypothetical protein
LEVTDGPDADRERSPPNARVIDATRQIDARAAAVARALSRAATIAIPDPPKSARTLRAETRHLSDETRHYSAHESL